MGHAQPDYNLADLSGNSIAHSVSKPANDTISPLEQIASAISGQKSNVVDLSRYQSSGYFNHWISQDYDRTSSMYTFEKREQPRNDFTDRGPAKHVSIFPESYMPGVLGFTYLGQAQMALRDDLISRKEEVDVHELIHTPDEYETRRITDWILDRKANDNYIR